MLSGLTPEECVEKVRIAVDALVSMALCDDCAVTLVSRQYGVPRDEVERIWHDQR